MKILVIGELNPDLILQNYSSFPELGKEVTVEDCVLTMGSATAICAMGSSSIVGAGEAARTCPGSTLSPSTTVLPSPI